MSEVFRLQSIRQITCGFALCFLAALLAVEAKVAWTACSGESPNDTAAIKLCPVAGKHVDPKLQDAPSKTFYPCGVLKGGSLFFFVAYPLKLKKVSLNFETGENAPKLSYLSPPLFFRPPPAH
jgi:hypothetical protein